MKRVAHFPRITILSIMGLMEGAAARQVENMHASRHLCYSHVASRDKQSFKYYIYDHYGRFVLIYCIILHIIPGLVNMIQVKPRCNSRVKISRMYFSVGQ